MQPYLEFAPIHLAQSEGIFSAHGLDVELVPMPGTEASVPLLIAGSVDVLPGQTAPGLLNAIARGERIRMVAQLNRGEGRSCSTLALVARPGLLGNGVAPGRAPRIRRISVNKQAVMVFFVEEALASVGVRLDTLERVYLPQAAEPDALVSGAIDVALTNEPQLTAMLRGGQAVPWIGQEDVLPGFRLTMLFFGRRLLDDDRDAGARFIAAYLEANRRLAEGATARNLERVARFIGEDPARLPSICWPFQPTDGQIRTDYLLRFQRFALERGWIDRLVPPDELIDAGFLPRASSPTASRP
jgi:NitT/TauT family transport system substrate-binding protein